MVRAWLYPNQLDGWHMVSPDKLVSWFLLMIISVVLVAWVYNPEPPEEPEEAAGLEPASGGTAAVRAGSAEG